MPNYSAVGGSVVSSPPGTPNPALAGLLGLIPGVGAMYNGQYAKGAVHLIVFVVLVSLADQFGPFGILIAGWVFYQVFEAYHTARARRDGTPLPNPFGLNDIGERFGFGRAWTAGSPTAAPISPVDATQVPPVYAASATPPPPSWGAPAYTYDYTYPEPPIAPTSYGAAVPPYSDPYVAPYADPMVSSQKRFPTGAIWLIAIGLLFFFGSTGFLRGFPIHRLIPFLLIGLGVWTFFHKMTRDGQTLTGDDSPGYRLRLFRALRGSVWLILVGVLFFLDTFYILRWGQSWPLFIIVAGLMTFLERAAYSAASVPAAYVPMPGPGSQTPSQSAPANPGSSIVSVVPHDEERR